MATIDVKNIEDQKVWDGFLQPHSEANFLQSWQWGEFHQALKKNIHRIGYYNNKKLIGVMLAVEEPAKRGKYLTVAGGPILDWKNKLLVASWADTLKKIAANNRCVFVRVRPQLVSDSFSKHTFLSLGFKNAPMHLSAELTHQLVLEKSEEELLKDMRKQTRYEIRKAEKLNIKIKASTDIKDLRNFYNLQVETAQRQGFVPFSYNFLRNQFEVFAKNNQVILYSSYYENKLLAQAFVIFYGQEAAYHYGASTELGRKYPGAYLIQWRAIQEAKKRGQHRYNFWGVAPEGQTGHRFAGVSLFKRGFGGEDVEYLHAQDLVINKSKYLINLAVESARRRIRKV